MSVEANKALIGHWVAAYNAGNLDIIDEIMTPDLITHIPTPPGGMIVEGRAGLKQSLAGIRAALPDQHETLDDLIADGDRVAWRWTLHGHNRGPLGPIPPTGRPVRITGIEIWRFADGQVVELWNEVDVLGFMQQLGLIPTPEMAGAV